MTKFQKIMLSCIAAVLTILIVAIILFVGKTDNLSSQENVLFNVLLTIFSIFISVIISQFYFDSSRQAGIEEIKRDYQSTTKLYAQKAAEKVDNLSNELTKLSVYLQQSDDRNFDTQTQLLISEEKIRSAIHIIETLKSVNDKSLSDWRGVIPEEEIDEQNEARAERESEFLQVLDSYTQLINKPRPEVVADENSIEPIIHQEIGDLSKKIDQIATSIIGTPMRKASYEMKKVDIVANCPACSQEIEYKQKPTKDSQRQVVCQECNSKFLSTWDPEVNRFRLEVYALGKAKGPATVPAAPLTEATIQLVKRELPEQPWPKGISKDIATKLGISHTEVRRAVKELIKRGVFKPQANGVVATNEIV